MKKKKRVATCNGRTKQKRGVAAAIIRPHPTRSTHLRTKKERDAATTRRRRRHHHRHHGRFRHNIQKLKNPWSACKHTGTFSGVCRAQHHRRSQNTQTLNRLQSVSHHIFGNMYTSSRRYNIVQGTYPPMLQVCGHRGQARSLIVAHARTNERTNERTHATRPLQKTGNSPITRRIKKTCLPRVVS